MKTIGILGGMGPGATANFYQKIIDICQEKHNAIQDTDYPKMVIYSLHLEGFDESGIIDNELVLKQLKEGINILNNSNCDFIVIPCNTVHLFINELREYSKVPILSIIEETVKLLKSETSVVGLLGSETTMQSNLYQPFLKDSNIGSVELNFEDQKVITSLILDVMQGNIETQNKAKVLEIIKKMEQVDAVILACTELPLAINKSDKKIYDTLQILAEAAVDYSVGKLNKST